LSVSPTQLGRAALVSALPPDAALFVFADLQQATKAVALDTELHMLYLVTPTNCTVWQGCDWNHLQNIFLKLLPGEKRVAKLLHLRFFSALALFDIINEKSIEDVASYFKISRGTLQTLQQQSATYAAMVVSFCSHLGWTYLRDLLRGFATRLAFGVRRELTELVSIEGIDASRLVPIYLVSCTLLLMCLTYRARIFHDHDITSMVELSNCTVKKIADLLSLAVPFSRCFCKLLYRISFMVIL
uniref:PCI domain-containing protein n=1 Tax=Angiostrongylus cantonensis TaxID=6313 RepID=A0A0K0DD22_ANGCA